MHPPSEPREPTLTSPPASSADFEVITADALLSAWFGCAMGETWKAALETPPHTWAEPGLARCHAVGRVVDAPAARLRAFVPDAVSQVSRKLSEKLGPGWGHSPHDRAEALSLFRLGTAALEESAYSFEAARAVARARSEEDSSDEALNAREASALRPRFFRMSRADELTSLWRYGNENAGMRSAQALTLSWMIVLERVTRARVLPPELRSAYVALALEAVARVPRPSGWTGHTVTEPWESYLRRATEAMTTAPSAHASAREGHALLVRAIAERLRAVAHPLPISELRRAALGAADANFRDTSAFVSEM